MPIFCYNSKSKCTCNIEMDVYRDHFSICRKHNKISVHNHIRNTKHFITSIIGTHANFVLSKDACKIEETNLLPAFPCIKPGDET